MMDDQDAVAIARQPRYWGFLIAAAYFLVVGIAYLAASVIFSGVFQGIVLVPLLLFGGGFVALWWYSGSVSDHDAP